MYIVYIIKSKKSGHLYKGYTEDLKSRLLTHNLGKVKSTKENCPWELIFYSVFLNKDKALEFEKYLKTGSGIAFLKKRLI